MSASGLLLLSLNTLILLVGVSIIVRHLRIPYTVSLVIAGVFVTLLFPASLPHFSPEVFLTFLLPPIIFQAGTKVDISDVRRDLKLILTYAFVGTLLSSILVGLLSYYALGFSPVEAFILGSIISPTDAVAVISILKRLGAPTRLTVIIEGETLFNDGVAVVLYSAITAAVLTGVFNPFIAVIGMILSIVMGAIVGGVVGYIVYRLMMVIDDNFVRILLSLLAAYGSYQIATGLNGSGYTSVAVAGIIIGSYVQIPQREVENLDMIWQFISFIVSSTSFVLIGIYVLPSLLGQYLVAILTSILIVLGARAITVYGLSPLMKSDGNNIPRKWQHIVVWAGLRGPVSVMLALGLGSLPLAQADKLTAITFGIVLFSILVQGLSMRFLLDKLRVQE